MGKTNIRTKPELCRECGICQLQCSLVYTGAFNPEAARIVIDPRKVIRFTEECVSSCSLCARHCPYGALEHIKGDEK